ncbi:Acetyltransferase (GNAT) domain / Serine palmitoyltransferase [hydrothermal vent metagenome]|uniref:Acetyltransferase (GNAT) domain / Serine palmitoyltransferase n=1 Tax=hydrothermal vent metagenome TaxID=652676 RepID=A0A3B0YKE7_9ZZZZ
MNQITKDKPNVSSLEKTEQISYQHFVSIRDISEKVWDNISKLPTPMRHAFLDTVESSGINNIEHHYLLIKQGNNDLGRANLYLTKTDFSTFDTTLPQESRETIKRWFPKFMDFRILECGFFTMIGQGLSLKNDSKLEALLPGLVKQMDFIASKTKADFCLFRDITIDSYDQYQKILAPLGYYPALGFANTALDIAWKTIDQFMDSVNSKTRLKFKNCLKLKQKFDIDIEFVSDFRKLAPVLATLWKNVHLHTKDYSREFLDEKFFATCAQTLPENSEVLLFRHQGEIIAFMLNLYGEDDYVVLDWGVDYDFKHYSKANLYRTATLLSLERAMALEKKTLELGITNYTPKMILGVDIIPLVYFVKHQNNTRHSKTLSQLLSSSVTQPESTAHEYLAKLNTPYTNIKQIQANIGQQQAGYNNNDLFAKIGRYHRADSMRLSGIYGLYPEFNGAQNSTVQLSNNKDLVLLGTNSYLGLATHPRVVAAAVSALQHYGTGCSGSPLLNGTLDIHKLLEQELAHFFSRQAALLCSTGYQTNLAAISALAGPGDILLMDARNHRSLFDGAKLSGADYMIYRHNDMAHLEKMLKHTAAKNKMIVVDSLFSMEGTIADLPSICKLAKLYQSRVFVDESHAVGVIGHNGRGVCELLNVEQDVDIIMGTFSKSFAALGGFLTGKAEIIDYIKHNAGAHIFSASLPASVVATIRAVLKIIRTEPERRQQILKKASYMANALQNMGYDAPYHGSQIVPIILGNYTLALAGYRKFMDDGVYVNPVGPPAVPEAASGFRTSYITTHQWDHLDKALEVFNKHRAHLIP